MKYCLTIGLLALSIIAYSQRHRSLVPSTSSKAADYLHLEHSGLFKQLRLKSGAAGRNDRRKYVWQWEVSKLG